MFWNLSFQTFNLLYFNRNRFENAKNLFSLLPKTFYSSFLHRSIIRKRPQTHSQLQTNLIAPTFQSYSKLKPIVYQPRNNSAEHKAETSEPRRNVEAEKHHSETEEHQSKDVMEEPEDNVEQEPKDDVAEHSDA